MKSLNCLCCYAFLYFLYFNTVVNNINKINMTARSRVQKLVQMAKSQYPKATKETVVSTSQSTIVKIVKLKYYTY